MSSLPTAVRTFDFDTEAAPSRKINATEVDIQLDLVFNYMAQLKDRFDLLTRSDDTLQDNLIRLRMLHTEVLNYIQANGGGGEVVGGGGDGYSVTDEPFSAAGTGLSSPLTADEAADYNEAFALYGFQGAFAVVAGDQRDWAAIQAALYKAAHTGERVRIPPGTYIVNRPLALQWKTPSDNVGQPNRPAVCHVYGSGVKSIIRGTGIAAGRAVFEMLGTSNQNACNIKFSNMVVEHDATCNVGSYCFRVGDAWCGWMMERVVMRGANGALIKVSSSTSYSQLCTKWTQCQVWTNWEERWGDDSVVEVYSLQVETGGAFFDNVHFDSCIFNGAAIMRARICKFTACSFWTPSQRPAGTYGANRNIAMFLGAIDIDCCYFEDHHQAIYVSSAGAPVERVRIHGSTFRGVQNFGGPAAPQAIYIADAGGLYRVGTVIIDGCEFRDELYTTASITLLGISAIVRGCSRAGVSFTGQSPRIEVNSNTRLVHWKQDLSAAYDSVIFTDKYRPVIPLAVGPLEVQQDTTGQASTTTNNPSVGTAASAATITRANGFEIRLIAFGPTHATLANQAWITTNLAGAPVVIGPGGNRRLQVDDNYVEAVRSVNANYGFVATNTNNGAAAYARVVAQSDAGVVQLAAFGSGHASLASQFWLYTVGAFDLILGANGSEIARLANATKRLKLRNLSTVGGVIFEGTASATVANTVAKSTIIPTGVGTVIIPANVLQVGGGFEIEIAGLFDSNSGETLTFEVTIQGVVLFTKAVVIAASSDDGFSLTIRGAIRTDGASGTLVAQGTLVIKDAVHNIAINALKAIDTTASATVGATVQHSVAHVTNSFRSTNFTVKVKH